MRRTKRNGGFFLCLALNMLLNLAGLVPAAILLGLHFWLGISFWWAVAAAALWLLGLILWMKIMGWAGRCSNTPDPPRQNRNPYSGGHGYREKS